MPGRTAAGGLAPLEIMAGLAANLHSANSLAGRAQGIEVESPQESASALSEDLERIARFFAVWEFAAQFP
jgi:hypothetical protein